MTVREATTDVFYAAFKSLTRKQKSELLDKMLGDREFREDLLDIALIEESKKDRGKPIPARDCFGKRRQGCR